MPRGRKPLTPQQLRLRGSFEPTRHNAGAPEFVVPPAAPDPPPWLSPLGIEVWRSDIIPLVESGVLRSPDLLLAGMAAESYSLWRNTVAALHSKPPSDRGYQALARAASAFWLSFTRSASELGLTPASRERLRRMAPVPGPGLRGVDRFVLREAPDWPDFTHPDAPARKAVK